MTAIARLGDNSSGHGPFPPTPIVDAKTSTVFINGIPCAVVGAEHTPHTVGRETHPQPNRNISAGSPNVFIEGKAVARIGDPIGCGDSVGQGSPNVFAN